MNIELIYDLDCPNVQATREQLLKALNSLGLPLNWTEWDRNASSSPQYAQQHGSPTILINGKDLLNVEPDANNCCRVYYDEITGEHKKAPSIEIISQAILNSQKISNEALPNLRHYSLSSIFAALPSIFIVLLPKLTCPLCWPLYTGILSAFGIPFANYTPYILPLTVIFLTLALFSLGFRAKLRHGYNPFILGLIAAMVITVGKFIFESNSAMYIGISILFAATIWNCWPDRKIKHCASCK